MIIRRLTLRSTLRLTGLAVLSLMFAFFLVTSAPYQPPEEYASELQLRAIGRARHSYHAHFGCFPPVHIHPTAKDVSWRVLILPCLGYPDLYARYDQSLPWNHEHNLKLLDSTPSEYLPVQQDVTSSPFTSYVMIADKDLVTNGIHPVNEGAFRGRAFHVIIGIEIRGNVFEWTNPADVSLTEAEALAVRYRQERVVVLLASGETYNLALFELGPSERRRWFQWQSDQF